MEMDFRMISSQSAWPCRSPIKLRRFCDPCDSKTPPPLRVSEVSMISRWNTFWKEDPLEWEPTFDHQFKSCDLNFPQWTKNVIGQTKHQQKESSWIRFQALIPWEKNPNSRRIWSFQGAPKTHPTGQQKWRVASFAIKTFHDRRRRGWDLFYSKILKVQNLSFLWNVVHKLVPGNSLCPFWDASKVKSPPTRGSKGHFESPGRYGLVISRSILELSCLDTLWLRCIEKNRNIGKSITCEFHELWFVQSLHWTSNYCNSSVVAFGWHSRFCFSSKHASSMILNQSRIRMLVLKP